MFVPLSAGFRAFLGTSPEAHLSDSEPNRSVRLAEQKAQPGKEECNVLFTKGIWLLIMKPSKLYAFHTYLLAIQKWIPWWLWSLVSWGSLWHFAMTDSSYLSADPCISALSQIGFQLQDDLLCSRCRHRTDRDCLCSQRAIRFTLAFISLGLFCELNLAQPCLFAFDLTC